MTQTITIPRQEQQLAVDHEVRFAMEETPQGKKQRFSVLFATGKPIAAHWGWRNLVIDLDSLKLAAKKMPLLLNHWQRIGFTTKIERTDEGYVAQGEFLANQEAQAILADAQQGFPFQASCWLQPGRIEEVLDGASAKVNGFTLQGPGWIWRDCECREVTVTELGADKNTKVEALSQGHVPLSVTVFTSVEGKTMTTPQDGPMTVARLTELHPDLVKSVREEAFTSGKAAGLTEGATAERQRTSRILKRATSSQFELAQKFVTEGTDYDAATDQLLADPRRNARETQTKLSDAAPPVVPPLSATQPPADESFEDRCQREFAVDKKLQQQFGGEVRRYIALQKHDPQPLAAGKV